MSNRETWKKDFKAYVESLSLSRDDYKGIMEYIDEFPDDHNADSDKMADGDCISRRDAIDALEKISEMFPYRIPGKAETYRQYNEAWCDAIDAASGELEKLPAVQPKPKWVSVKESMPENDERVLICGIRGGIAIARKAIGNPVFGAHVFWVQGNKIMTADAWQRLPDPYVKEGVK